MSKTINLQFGAKYATYEDGLSLTVYENDNNSEGIYQLQAIIPNLKSIHDAGLKKSQHPNFGLLQLHKHKCQLHVIWKDKKSFETFYGYIQEIWDFLKGGTVLHYIGNDNQLIWSSEDEQVFND